ncbi:hypothetical protein FRC03_001084 [Tulasnella sp. 419]|nr:hypothetical protein FRC03_001084 [Tulasnella sp. 419]
MDTTTSNSTASSSQNNTGKIIAAVLGSVLILLAIAIWVYRSIDQIKRFGHRIRSKDLVTKDGRAASRPIVIDTGKGQSRVEMSELSEKNVPISTSDLGTREGTRGDPGPSSNPSTQSRRETELLDKMERQPLPVSPQSAASDTMLLPPISSAGPTPKSLLRRFSLSKRPRSELPPLSINPWGGSRDLLLPARPHTMEVFSATGRSTETIIARPAKAASTDLPPRSASESPRQSSHETISPESYAQVQFESGTRVPRTRNTVNSGRTSTTFSHLSGSPSLSSIHTADLFFNFLRQPSSSPSRSRPASSRQSSSPSSNGTLPFAAFARRSSNPLLSSGAQELTESPQTESLAGTERSREETVDSVKRDSDSQQTKRTSS